MQGRFKPIGMLILALMIGATSISSAGQTVSRAGHVTLIAIMPEKLTLSINSGSFMPAASPGDNPEIATGVTTGWSLLPGRAQVETWATTNHLTAPVIVATALPMGIGPVPDEPLQSNSLFGFAVRPNISSVQLAGMFLKDNRSGASTASLADSPSPLHRPWLAANTSPGTLKIQVQAVL